MSWQDHVFGHTTLDHPSQFSSYMCFILISVSADVELKPGPADFSCGNCAIEVLDTDAALECEECGLWFPIQCQAISQETYDDLIATDQYF